MDLMVIYVDADVVKARTTLTAKKTTSYDYVAEVPGLVR